MSYAKELPQLIDKSPEEISVILAEVAASNLTDETKAFVESVINLSVWLPKALVEQQITVSNLQKLVFGRGSNTKSPDVAKATADKVPQDSNDESEVEITKSQAPSTDNSVAQEEQPYKPSNKAKGHGRLPHTAYPNATEYTLTIDELTVGQMCPSNCGGKLGQFKPGVLVRIKGQAMADVHKYWVEKLRCNLCTQLYSADIPVHVGDEKYDYNFKAQLVLQKYYVAVPFNRQKSLQGLLDLPLPLGTQWKIIDEVANPALSVFPEIEKIAANGEVTHNDDTHCKILSIINDNKTNPEKKRRGMHTTGVISKNGDRTVALFYSGINHAGENLERILKHRAAEKEPIIQMCDALSRNKPKAFETILCNCISHGYRRFEDLKAFYPEPCLKIIKLIGDVYDVEDSSTEQDLDNKKRLAHLQKHSTPLMDELHAYLNHLLDNKIAEPNDSLGKAIKYMLKHWHELTQFLRIEGAPLDNNVVERSLKIPIRGRRTWLFYKTEYGAMIGSVLTSIIHTCELSNINPLEYLVALQQYKSHVVKEPCRFLPWNYQETVNLINLSGALAA